MSEVRLAPVEGGVADPSDARRKELDAHRRAMPLQRLIGNGMESSDAVALYAQADRGFAWDAACDALGNAKLAQAQAAERDGQLLSARLSYRHASACYRFGQSSLPEDDAVRIAMYRKAIDAFGGAGALETPKFEKIVIPYRGAALSGWLMKPSGVVRPAVVMIFGGADGLREEYHLGAEYLIQRGVAAFLVDGPGQGESRMLQRLYVTADEHEGFRAVIDVLEKRSDLDGRVAIWGNSMGGCFAARTASFDQRIVAACVCGGPAEPGGILQRFPRFILKLRAITGAQSDDAALRVITALRLRGADNRVTCPLLQLHGGADQVVTLEEARPIYDEALARDKTLLLWDDGDHCVYNHSHEKHCAIADWFAARLLL